MLGLELGFGLGLSLRIGLSLILNLGLGLILGKSLDAGEGALDDKKSKCSNHICCLGQRTEMFVVQPMGSLRFKIR